MNDLVIRGEVKTQNGMNPLRGLIGGVTMALLFAGSAAAQVSFEELPKDAVYNQFGDGWSVLAPDGTPLGRQETEEDGGSLVILIDGVPQQFFPPEQYSVGDVLAAGVNSEGELVVLAKVYDTENLWNTEYAVWIGEEFGLLDSPGEGNFYPIGISDDGTVIVGDAIGGAETAPAFWRCAGTACEEGFLDSGAFPYGVAVDASGDGSVIAGSVSSDVQPSQVARWVLNQISDEYEIDLLDSPAGYESSWARAISADGNVIVGQLQPDEGDFGQAAQWRGDTEGTLLEGLEAELESRANAVNHDGSRIVGFANSSSGWQALLWNAEGEATLISDIVAEAGVDLGELQLREATGISADGRTILGVGGFDDRGLGMVNWLMFDDSISTLTDLSSSFASIGGITSFSNQLPHQNASFQSALMGTGGSGSERGSGPELGYAPAQATPESIVAIDALEQQQRNWRLYGFVEGGTDGSQSEVSADVGIAHLLHPDFMVGFGAGFRHATVDLSGGSSANTSVLSATAFANYAPDTGPQAMISATFARLDTTISRGYLNGATPVNSTGTTAGLSYGMEARFGWRVEINDDIGVTPFVSYADSLTSFSGYTETSGPMPATIAAFADRYAVVRLGVSADMDLEGGHRLRGHLNWAHVLDPAGTMVSGQIGAATVAGAGGAGLADWLEAGAALDFNLGDNWTLSTAVNASIHNTGLSGAARAGLIKAF